MLLVLSTSVIALSGKTTVLLRTFKGALPPQLMVRVISSRCDFDDASALGQRVVHQLHISVMHPYAAHGFHATN